MSHLEATAYHEAGHVIAAWQFRRHISLVTIKPDEDSVGSTFANLVKGIANLDCGDVSPAVQRRVENYAIIHLAGPAAQRKYNARSVRLHHRESDRTKVCTILSYLCEPTQEVLRAYYHLMDLRARAVVQNPINWQAIGILAQELLRRRTIAGKDLRDFIATQCFALNRV